MAKQVGRKPDYKASVVVEGEYYRIGSGWLNESGTISVKLHAFVTIPPSVETTLMLIPSDFKPKG